MHQKIQNVAKQKDKSLGYMNQIEFSFQKIDLIYLGTISRKVSPHKSDR